MQPFAGVAFVLDGVLIGAGDLRYLAVSGVVAMTVFLPAAGLVHVLGGGLISLWLAIGLWMLVRFVTLTLQARSDAWLVTGAVRR
jgi:Na+-driven multidrug efflux pump